MGDEGQDSASSFSVAGADRRETGRDGDGTGAIGSRPGDVPVLHRLARELEGGVSEVEAVRFHGVALTGEKARALGERLGGVIARAVRQKASVLD